MKTALKLSISISVLFFLISSFCLKSDSNYIGTYGDSIMELVLNEDHTFTFKSSFDSENKVNQKGTWKIKRGKALLKFDNKYAASPRMWKFKNEGKTIKSRNKFVFYTLHKKD